MTSKQQPIFADQEKRDKKRKTISVGDETEKYIHNILLECKHIETTETTGHTADQFDEKYKLIESGIIEFGAIVPMIFSFLVLIFTRVFASGMGRFPIAIWSSG